MTFAIFCLAKLDAQRSSTLRAAQRPNLHCCSATQSLMNVLFLSTHAIPLPADLAAHAKDRNQNSMTNAVLISEAPFRALDQVFELWLPFQHVCLRSRSDVRSHQ